MNVVRWLKSVLGQPSCPTCGGDGNVRRFVEERGKYSIFLMPCPDWFHDEKRSRVSIDNPYR